MNAQPEQITVSIALSAVSPVEALDEIYDGIRTACRIYDVDLVGGDDLLPAAPIIQRDGIRAGRKDKLTYRSGARGRPHLHHRQRGRRLPRYADHWNAKSRSTCQPRRTAPTGRATTSSVNGSSQKPDAI